jgi:hypothetical protein
MLTERQLAKMRRTANLLLPDIATILRQMLVDDGAGGKQEVYDTENPVGTSKCRFSAMDVKTRMKDQATGGRIQPNEGFIVSLPLGTDVQETDRLVINGETYDVISAADKRSFEVNLRFVVKRVI